jgi:predicted RNA methylase
MTTLIKLTFIEGLKDIVLQELADMKFHVVEIGDDEVYINSDSSISLVRKLRSIITISIVTRDEGLNPLFVSKHKSLLGQLIERVLRQKTDTFKTFTLSCAGSDSQEVKDIRAYVANTYKLTESADADLKIFIGKSGKIWEMGVQATIRPLSLRDYRVENIKGGLNPTIAYAMNTLCDLSRAKNYLNIFSGSGTLMIEAGLLNPELNLTGFDNNGTSIAMSVKNIKKAGLIKQITLKNADIFSGPDLGTFDVIVSDLPFGMSVSKGDDLPSLYRAFASYAKATLNPEGILVAYTSEYEILETALTESGFKIEKSLLLTVPTSVNSYLDTKIFVCILITI